ncbi:MAG: gfo/Idh/MocA family oxidoreductase [Runella slithyformis]|nr:MAG: gfo/Idh/MocA family oxidoreductase [Runella slithyformis]TAF28422.1 MAG: gfo/Idh/MocA family oxidoreductase [Runella slithyformis]TAF47045.1 MAG: gfo/Idh/MocA family oxidoreductase [Runella slithyformis]TAF82006.1 MAG: gfo/Idh/MocA family oxidoreductase [Runella slithyformis]
MKNVSRREFLEKIGIGTSAITVLPSLTTNAHNLADKKLNVALCGLGRYADFMAYGLKSSKYCRIAGLVSGTPTKAAEWAKKYNVPKENVYNYQNFDEIIHNKDIDLVYVLLPNAMHKEYVIRAAKAGKHIIVEKPMALNARDCEEMIAVCQKMGVQLAMGYRLHFEPYHLELKRLGQEKVFGQVRFIEVSLGYKTDGPGANPNEWRMKKALSGGGPLMNLGVYCVQSCRYVLGEEPTSVTAQFGPNTNLKYFAEVEASITWQLHFPSGAVGSSTSCYNAGIDRFYATADDGDFELSPAVSYGPFKGKTSKGVLSFPDINQQTQQMDEIAQVLLANQPLPTHIAGEEGLKDMKVMDAIYKSARTGKRVLIG